MNLQRHDWVWQCPFDLRAFTEFAVVVCSQKSLQPARIKLLFEAFANALLAVNSALLEKLML